ncbi:MAG TPA: LysR family transcriptional regulator [Bacteriovoracaceae bacterium]|nr:LysR family transcriptional regulator [Bacteriovoracaceae bacterium]
METFELRYFLGVAGCENIHKASQNLHVSPAALSKAVSRLEDELGVNLFVREGRNIRLSPQGQLLRLRASEIIRLEEATKLELSGGVNSLQVRICATEILLSQMGVTVSDTLLGTYPGANFQLTHTLSDRETLALIRDGQAHLGIVTAEVSGVPGLKSKLLGHSSFETYVGQGHPLFQKRSVSVASVLEHPFVSIDQPLLGKVAARQSLDGWRDDKFPRKITYLVSSLKTLEELVVSGKAVAYLPQYYGEKLAARAVSMTGCPYACEQKIKLIAKHQKDIGWINRLF